MRFIYTKTFAVFFVCLVVLTVLVFLQVKGFLAPVQAAFLQAPRPVVYIARTVGLPVKNFFTTIYQLRRITRENGELTQKVYQLQKDLVDFEQEKRENDALRQELGFFENSPQQYQACTVLAENPLGLTDTLVLNCGSEKGVQEGAAVVSQGYLVGKITFAGRNSSTALLITNSKFSADAQVSKTAATGVARGSFGSGIILDQLSQNQQLEKGWMIVTGGINDKVPKGILIGEVGDIISGQNDLFKQSTLLSPIDFNNLQFVFVAK